MTGLASWQEQQPVAGDAGSWLAEHALADPWSVATFTTTAFEAYAVLPNGTEHASLSEFVAARLRRILTEWTAPGQECVQAVWEAYGEIGGGTQFVEMRQVEIPRVFSPQVEDLSRFEMPFRTHHAFAATLRDLTPRPWRREPLDDSEQSPTVFWPTSRTWLLASEIDLTVTFVGGPAALINAVVADAGLFARPVEAQDPIDLAWDMDDPFEE